jgi:hypothetical protein
MREAQVAGANLVWRISAPLERAGRSHGAARRGQMGGADGGERSETGRRLARGRVACWKTRAQQSRIARPHSEGSQ